MSLSLFASLTIRVRLIIQVRLLLIVCACKFETGTWLLVNEVMTLTNKLGLSVASKTTSTG